MKSDWKTMDLEDFQRHQVDEDVVDRMIADVFYQNEWEPFEEDVVNKPLHYRQGDIECIEAMRSALNETEFRGYCKGAAFKYIWREEHKGGDESLEKAIWYLKEALRDV